jgi:lactoylglutathione lyase
MQFSGYHHTGLYAKDAEKSLDFYTKGLGGKVAFSFPMAGSDKTIYLVDLGGNAVIEIIPKGNGEEETNVHWAHIAIRTDDAKAAYEMAIKAGAVCRIGPKEVKLGTMSVCHAFVYGPDREVLEFFQVL